jgi:hypothetical protein
MKKILLLVLLTFYSCIGGDDPTTLYYIEYEVHYPDRCDTLSAVKEFFDEPKVNSYRGSNVIYYVRKRGSYQILEPLIETSAPLNIIKVQEQSTK